MNTNTFFGKRIFPVLFMAIITILCITPVSAIFISTKERVQLNESLFLKRAVLFAANIEIPETPAEVDSLFNSRIETVGEDPNHAEYFKVLISGSADVAGYVLPVQGPGLWGTISAVVGFADDLKTITGVEFTDQNETPGLGGRITESWFKEQFRGKGILFELKPEGTASAADEIDAITGATRTSNFVQQLMLSAGDRMIQIGSTGEGN